MQKFWLSFFSPSPPNFLYPSFFLPLSLIPSLLPLLSLIPFPHFLFSFIFLSFHFSFPHSQFLSSCLYFSAIIEITGVENGVVLGRASIINSPYKKNKEHEFGKTVSNNRRKWPILGRNSNTIGLMPQWKSIEEIVIVKLNWFITNTLANLVESLR